MTLTIKANGAERGTAIAPAVGARLRHLPMRPQKLLEALAK
jgi:CO/xanthine dehydrogenase Mo-binding subunit